MPKILFVLSLPALILALRSIPVDINENYEDPREIPGGSISDLSFANEIVTALSIDCTYSPKKTLPELPKGFLGNLRNLTQLLIKCYVKRIQPGALYELPEVKNIDLSDNELTNLQSGVFDLVPSLLYLNLSKNWITSIDEGAFGNMPRLADLDLSHNRLSSIQRAWFTNTSTLEEFHVNNNSLKEIPEGMFSGWKRIYALNFDHNEISRIQDRAFANISHEINFLSLHRNLLTSLNLKAFPEAKTTVLQVDLSSNLLNFLPVDFSKRLQVKKIWIFGNPFSCPCLREAEVRLLTRGVQIEQPQAAEGKCPRVDAPSCVVAPRCLETEDSKLSEQLTRHMRALGYASLGGWYEECFVPPLKMYLDS